MEIDPAAVQGTAGSSDMHAKIVSNGPFILASLGKIRISVLFHRILGRKNTAIYKSNESGKRDGLFENFVDFFPPASKAYILL
jgi:hypothetical protein